MKPGVLRFRQESRRDSGRVFDPSRGGLGRLRFREALAGYLLILPWLLGYVGLTLGPMLASVYLALSHYDIIAAPRWAGLANFSEAFFRDALFWHSLKVTAIYTFTSVPLHLIAGLTVALMLNQNVKLLSVFRTIYYLPAVVTGVAVAFLWAWLFNPDYGLVNSLLYYAHIKGPGWFYSTEWALPTFVLMSLWGIGGSMVIYLAGLQGIPTHLYEAADLDGAGRWSKFIHVTIPMISPVLFFNLVMGIIGSFQVFTNAYVITQGGPANATLFYLLYLFNNGFRYYRMGYASALAWVLFAIILGFTLLNFKVVGRHVYYEAGFRK